jgi:aromatic-L-amino-acid decarboxylase
MSTAGTTNTGAIDPLSQIAEVCEAERLWHHVDGAYGGFFHLVSELQGRLAGLSRADSLALDPHKGLFLPYGVGAVLVRDGDALKSAHSVSAGYLPFIPDDAYSPSDHGPELTRDYRGLRLWLPLKLFGAARFRAALREKHMLTVWACEQLAAIDAIAIDAEPALSLFAFHVRGASLAEENATTRELVERVTARGRVMITGATVGDRFMARICVLSFRTRREHVEHAVEDILDAARALHGRT